MTRQVDYIYRFNEQGGPHISIPTTAAAAQKELEYGNQQFARWMQSCQAEPGSSEPDSIVIQCEGLHAGGGLGNAEVPHQDPFAIVVGCSDARVPIEMVFGQGFNEMFVVRVAGNVLAQECWGSIDYAVSEMKKSIKLIVVVGHTGCGAVTAAVDSYLDPHRAMGHSSFAVSSILQHIFMPVHRAANGLAYVWGANAAKMPGYRKALIDISVCLNAAASAYDIRVINEATRHADVHVVFGVYDMPSQRVSMPPASWLPKRRDQQIHLADALIKPGDFDTLARNLAKRLKPK